MIFSKPTAEFRILAIVIVAFGLFLLKPGFAGAYTVIINPSDDAYLLKSQPDRQLGALSNVEHIKLTAGVNISQEVDSISLLHFDLSSIPDNASVSKVSLYLYARPTSDTTVLLYRSDFDLWDEETVTWNSYGTTHTETSTGVSHRILVYGAQWFEYSIDLNANSWWAADITDNLTTLVLRPDTGTSSYTGPANFASKEFTGTGGNYYKPYLEITYTPVPLPASVWLLFSGLLGITGLKKRIRNFRCMDR